MATLLKVLNNLADIKSAGVLHFASELRRPSRCNGPFPTTRSGSSPAEREPATSLTLPFWRSAHEKEGRRLAGFGQITADGRRELLDRVFRLKRD